MGINLGSAAISDLKLGSTQVSKVYLGTEAVWSKSQPAIKALKFSCTGTQTIGFNASTIGSLTPTFQYSLDGGSTWTTWADVTAPVSFGNGTDLYLRGMNNVIASSASVYCNIVFSESNGVDCSGNIMHLFDYTQDLTTIPGGMGFRCLFKGCSQLLTAPELPATGLVQFAYYGLFQNCTSLTTPPALPATTLSAASVYRSMFEGCTSLTTAPALPATNTTGYAYESMFKGCTSLTTIPSLAHASSSSSYAYQNMFYNCSKIKVSTTRTSLYKNALTFSYIKSATNMFYGTGGTFTGAPSSNTTYYTSNTIVSPA